ncbi:transposon Pol polyprotein, partial [archaeon]
MIENKTWELVRRPKDANILKNRWVFTKKFRPNGEFIKYKARGVIKGFLQEHGVDYDQTYSPTVPWDLLRMFFAICAALGLEIHSMDAVTAFLNGILKHTVYMEQFEGFEDPDHPQHEWVCLLKKALYGLRQAPLLWFETCANFLISQGFTPLALCPCWFLLYHKDTNMFIMILLYVDDFLIATKNAERMAWAKALLSKRFKMTDMGPVHSHLGMQILTTPTSISLTNPIFITDMLAKHGFTNVNPISTPLPPGYYPEDDPEVPRHPNVKQYQEAVGELMWLMVTYRYDIATAVGFVARFSHNPSVKHWDLVLRIMKYLKGTVDFKITYRRTAEFAPVGYTDSDWAGDTVDRKSTSGMVVTMGGAVVAYGSTKQSITAHTSTEAELIAAVLAAKQIIFMRNIYAHILQVTLPPTPLHIDNQSAIDIATSYVVNKRSKHIDLRYHIIKEYIRDGVITLVDTKSADNLADLFTKSVPTPTFTGLLHKLLDNTTKTPPRTSTRNQPSASLTIAIHTLSPLLTRSLPS